jgi:hypothetical protein
MPQEWIYSTALVIVRTRLAASLILESGERCPKEQLINILFVVVSLLAYAIEEFAASAQIETEVEVMLGLCISCSTSRTKCHGVQTHLEVVVEGDDVRVPAGDLLEDGDLVADHVFPALHELLVDDLARIVLVRLDVDGLFDDRVRAAAERLAGAILYAISKA